MRSAEPAFGRQLPSTVVINERSLNVFPLRYRASLRYHDEIDLGVVGNTPVANIFAANGLFDPDITGSGHQPMGFDQLMTFFQHYTVLNARIKAQIINDADSSQVVMGAACVMRGSTALTSWNRLIEEGNVQHCTVGGATQGGSPLPPWFNLSVNIADFQSIPDALNDSTLRGTAAANPATVVGFALYGYSPTGSTTGHIGLSVTIEFDAVFTEPLQLIQS